MKRLGWLLGIGVVIGASAPAWATDIVNQDKKTYTVTVVVGNITSTKKLAPGDEIYGICNADDCTLKIPGSSLAVGRNDRVVIHGGKLGK
jgi:hypothetical protein